MNKVPTFAEIKAALKLVSYNKWEGRQITREKARLLGLSRYFTGVACSLGHIDDRLVSTGVCVECSRTKQRHERAVRRESRELRK